MRKLLKLPLLCFWMYIFPPKRACLRLINQPRQNIVVSLCVFFFFFKGYFGFPARQKQLCVAIWCYKVRQTETKSCSPSVCLLPKLLFRWEPLFWCPSRDLHIHPGFDKLLPDTSGTRSQLLSPVHSEKNECIPSVCNAEVSSPRHHIKARPLAR